MTVQWGFRFFHSQLTGRYWPAPTYRSRQCTSAPVCVFVRLCVCVHACVGVPISLSINLNELLALRSDVSLDGLPADPRSVVYFLLDG